MDRMETDGSNAFSNGCLSLFLSIYLSFSLFFFIILIFFFFCVTGHTILPSGDGVTCSHSRFADRVLLFKKKDKSRSVLLDLGFLRIHLGRSRSCSVAFVTCVSSASRCSASVFPWRYLSRTSARLVHTCVPSLKS